MRSDIISSLKDWCKLHLEEKEYADAPNIHDLDNNPAEHNNAALVWSIQKGYLALIGELLKKPQVIEHASKDKESILKIALDVYVAAFEENEQAKKVTCTAPQPSISPAIFAVVLKRLLKTLFPQDEIQAKQEELLRVLNDPQQKFYYKKNIEVETRKVQKSTLINLFATDILTKIYEFLPTQELLNQVEISVPPILNAQLIGGNLSNYLLIRIDDGNQIQLLTWGRNEMGQLGNGNNEHQYRPINITTLLPLNPDFEIQHFIANDGSVFVLAKNPTTGEQQLITWGRNEFGQLGNGNNVDQNHPIDITAFLPLKLGFEIQYLVLNEYSTFLLAENPATREQQLLAWGGNYYGQLGNGNNIDQSRPIDITAFLPLDPGFKIQHLIVTEYSTFLLAKNPTTTEQQLMTWGRNEFARLGNGNNINQNRPIDITAFLPLKPGFEIQHLVSENVANAIFLLAKNPITGEQQLLTWGSNNFGELGNGNNIDQNCPIDITALLPLKPGFEIQHLIAGNASVFLLAKNPTTGEQQLMAWGNNYYGQLGNSNNQHQNHPIDITAFLPLTPGFEIQHLVSHLSIFLLAKNPTTRKQQLMTWGRNEFGQLANGNYQHQNRPIDITSSLPLNLGSEIQYVIANVDSVFLLTKNPTTGGQQLLAWGRNEMGQLGNGNNEHQNQPLEIHLLSLLPIYQLIAYKKPQSEAQPTSQPPLLIAFEQQRQQIRSAPVSTEPHAKAAQPGLTLNV